MMPREFRDWLTPRARRLRGVQTDAERRLWSRLRDRQVQGAKFRRQVVVGSFIADFCCVDPKLIVECDGGQHAVRVCYDLRRTAFLERSGYRVLRFWNREVLAHTDAVVEEIARVVQEMRAPQGARHRTPSPPRRG